MTKKSKPVEIDFNPEFQSALGLMEETDKNIFITGRAGTGKSTLLNYFRDNTKKNAVILAPTGVAAVNVGGQTIHSFFHFKPNVTLAAIKKKRATGKEKTSIYKKLKTIVIDEVSMVRADLLDCVDKFLRLNGPRFQTPLRRRADDFHRRFLSIAAGSLQRGAGNIPFALCQSVFFQRQSISAVGTGIYRTGKGLPPEG